MEEKDQCGTRNSCSLQLSKTIDIINGEHRIIRGSLQKEGKKNSNFVSKIHKRQMFYYIETMNIGFEVRALVLKRLELGFTSITGPPS